MTKDKQLKNEIYKERLEMRKKIFILFLILIPFNVFALTKAPIDITNETVTSLSQALNEEIITSEELINIYLERIKTDWFLLQIFQNQRFLSKSQFINGRW